jgi:hypothetical protein
MKKLFFTVLLALFATAAQADTLRFAWDYDAAAQAIIEGFRLHRDGQPLPLVIAPSARTVDTPYLEDRQSHTYFLTAFAGEDESVPSASVTVPAFFTGIPSVIEGTFRFEIIKVE